jgi:hypothetical protein
MPLLGYIFRMTHPTAGMPRDIYLQKMIALLLEDGADLEEKFLYPTLGLHAFGSDKNTHMARPCYVGFRLNSKSFDLLLEINCIELILLQFVGSGPSTADKIATISRLGLDIERAHSKVLLYFYKDTVYGAEDEDSDTLNRILDWPPPSRIHQADGREAEEDGEAKEDGDMEYEKGDWLIKRRPQFKKVRRVLKGKEVNDVKKWLTDRGHVWPEDSDMAAISDQASVHEMARIYERISKTVGYGRKM